RTSMIARSVWQPSIYQRVRLCANLLCFDLDEIDGCFDAWSSCEGIDLYQIQQDTLWRGILIERPRAAGQTTGTPAAFPCDRGTYLQLGTRELLVWTQGNVQGAIGGKNYYKEGKGIPHPLLLKRFAGHGGWDEQVRILLGLTKELVASFSLHKT